MQQGSSALPGLVISRGDAAWRPLPQTFRCDRGVATRDLRKRGMQPTSQGLLEKSEIDQLLKLPQSIRWNRRLILFSVQLNGRK